VRLRCLLNAPGGGSVQLAGAQRAFGSWGDRDDFAWWFERSAGGPTADLLQLSDGGQPVAGIAIVYRRVRTPSGESALAGIMSAAWTDPAERRRGHFATLVDECHAVAAGRGAQLLLAFIGVQRPSSDLLLRLAHSVAPTWGLIDDPGTGDTRPGSTTGELRPAAVTDAELHSRFAASTTHGLCFEYEPLGVFVEQARLRRDSVVVVDVLGGWAIAERDATGGLQVHTVVARHPDGVAGALASLRGSDGRGLRAFTSEREVAEPLLAAGMRGVPGRLYVIGLGAHPPPAGEWTLQAIDRA
jgi:hypothetical protein